MCSANGTVTLTTKFRGGDMPTPGKSSRTSRTIASPPTTISSASPASGDEEDDEEDDFTEDEDSGGMDDTPPGTSTTLRPSFSSSSSSSSSSASSVAAYSRASASGKSRRSATMPEGARWRHLRPRVPVPVSIKCLLGVRCSVSLFTTHCSLRSRRHTALNTTRPEVHYYLFFMVICLCSVAWIA
jgi:hypothetical protein